MLADLSPKIPYLTFSTYSETGAELTKSGKKVEKLLKAYGIQNKNDNEDSDMATGNDSRRIIHSSRTLDQFYYHSLKDTKSRDSDQVVTRYTHYESRVDKALDILRVDELWLWVIDEGMSQILLVSLDLTSRNRDCYHQLYKPT